MEDVKPGGSASAPGFGLDGGAEFRSRTHCGGGGGGIDVAMVVNVVDVRGIGEDSVD